VNFLFVYSDFSKLAWFHNSFEHFFFYKKKRKLNSRKSRFWMYLLHECHINDLLNFNLMINESDSIRKTILSGSLSVFIYKDILKFIYITNNIKYLNEIWDRLPTAIDVIHLQICNHQWHLSVASKYCCSS